MSGRPLRVMIDTNVLISGVIFPRAACEILQHALRREFVLVLSEQILAELHLWMETRATRLQRIALETFLEEASYELVPDPSWEEVQSAADLVRDPKDVPVVLAAIRAGVDYLVTNDRDLIAQDETTAQLRRHMTPMHVATFLRQVMGWTSEELEAIRHRTWEEME